MTKTTVNQQLKPLIAKFIGTLFLALTIGGISTGIALYADYQALYLPLAIGLILALMVYVFGSISGGHFNPAVSFSLFLVRKITFKQLLINLIGQILGAFAGFALAKLLMGVAPSVPAASTTSAMLGEFIGAFLLVLVVTGVVLGKISQVASGLVIGMALMLGVSLSLATSGGLLNPALAIALGAYHLSYLLMPLLGGGVAAGLVVWLYQTEPSDI